MMKNYLKLLVLIILLIPLNIFAAGGFNVSNTNISMYPGESKTITITSDNTVGRLNIMSSNTSVASVNTGSIFIQNPGANSSITITGNSVGTSTISVVASDNFATMDEEILAGQTKTITVNVIAKPTPPVNNTTNNNQGTNNHQYNNLSRNNNIKSISVDNYDLVKVDNNNYTLTVSNDVASININATPEDSKAKVSGTGVKELKVGENNIEIIITSESGSQNKINIKVTKKDGYYLEDLESLLEKNNINEIDIIINKDTILTKEQLNKIRNSNKNLKLNYFDEEKKLVYSWHISEKEIKNIDELNTTIDITNSNEEIAKLANYADGLYIDFKYQKELSKNTNIKLYIGNKFKNNSILNIYYYNNTNKKLEFIKDNIQVKDGYVEFDIKNASTYFITMSTINDIIKKDSNLLIIISITELILIIFLTIYIIIEKKNNKSDYSEIDIKELEESQDINNPTNDNLNNEIDSNMISSIENNNSSNIINYYADRIKTTNPEPINENITMNTEESTNNQLNNPTNDNLNDEIDSNVISSIENDNSSNTINYYADRIKTTNPEPINENITMNIEESTNNQLNNPTNDNLNNEIDSNMISSIENDNSSNTINYYADRIKTTNPEPINENITMNTEESTNNQLNNTMNYNLNNEIDSNVINDTNLYNVINYNEDINTSQEKTLSNNMIDSNKIIQINENITTTISNETNDNNILPN